MYERFRSDVAFELQEVDTDTLAKLLKAMDKVAMCYEMTMREDAKGDAGHDRLIDVYCRDLELSGRSKNTTRLYRFYLTKLHEYLGRELTTAKKDDLRNFIYIYQDEHQLSDRTTALMLTVIKAFYLWCVDEEYIDKDPSHAIKPIKCEKKIKEPLDEFTMGRIRRGDMTLRDKALIEVAFSTGCRVNELRTMELSKVDFANQRVKIMGKGSKERYVLLNVSSILALQEYLATRTDNSPFVFVSDREPHEQLTKSGIMAIFRRIKNENNLQEFSCHKIRHTFACTMANKGAELQVIQSMMGHSNINTTTLYAVVTDDRIKSEHWRCIV